MLQSILTEVIRECHTDGHAGHHGVLKTRMAFRQRYHAKGAKKAIRRYVNDCEACKRAKLALATDQVPLSPAFAPDPFNAIAVDLYKPGVALPLPLRTHGGGFMHALGAVHPTSVQICRRGHAGPLSSLVCVPRAVRIHPIRQRKRVYGGGHDAMRSRRYKANSHYAWSPTNKWVV